MNSKLKNFTLKSAKLHVVLSLAVVTVGVALPDNSVSKQVITPGIFCGPGDLGDCETLTYPPNSFFCAEGGFWDDCETVTRPTQPS